MIPGELVLKNKDIACNVGKKTTKVSVKNTGDRPIQVGSHYHFFETNKYLDFNREEAFGMRLNVPASTAVRFEPGEEKEVTLVEFGGAKTLYGLNNLTNGDITKDSVKAAALAKAKKEGYKGA